MERIFISLLLVFNLNSFCQNQKLPAVALKSHTVSIDSFIGLDGLGGYYFTKNNVFIKQSNGQTWEYKNISLGTITKVDLLNPLKIVLFYENFNTIIILDNQLNEIQKINFSEINSTLVATKIGLASQNQLWVYDSMSQQISLFDYSKNSRKPLGQPLQENPKYTFSDYNYFYWIDVKNRWFSCDVYGKITFLSDVSYWKQIQILNSETFIFYDGKSLYFQNNTSKTVSEIEIVEKSFEKFYYKDQILAIFTNQEIKNYKITLP